MIFIYYGFIVAVTEHATAAAKNDREQFESKDSFFLADDHYLALSSPEILFLSDRSEVQIRCNCVLLFDKVEFMIIKCSRTWQLINFNILVSLEEGSRL